MNQDQIINLIQTLFKVGGGALVAKGAIDSQKWEWITGLVMAVVTFILSHKWNATPDTQGTLPLRSLLFFFMLPALLLSGCARMTVIQDKTDADGSASETRLHVTTFFDAHSDIAKLKTTSTDKTQGVSVGSINDDSSGSNAVNVIHAVVEAAVTAAAKTAVPK